MRTQEEIVTYARKQQKEDFFGFALEVVIPHLDVEHAKEFLKEDADLSTWKQEPLEVISILTSMKQYMEFAWEKCLDHRGLSAGRSVDKMQAWLWLLEEDDLLRFAESSANYAQYGAPILRKICEHYGWPLPEGSDMERMSKGETCSPDCDGCGH